MFASSTVNMYSWVVKAKVYDSFSRMKPEYKKKAILVRKVGLGTFLFLLSATAVDFSVCFGFLPYQAFKLLELVLCIVGTVQIIHL